MSLNDAQVAVVGGTGRMGSWMAGLLERRGHRVLRTGRRTRLRAEDAAGSSQVVIVSVPVQRTAEIIRRVGPLVGEDGLLMDLTSVKKEPVHAMLANSRAQVVGLHPLFGPDAGPSKSPLTVAVCPGRGKEGLRWITRVLRTQGYDVGVIEPGEHDRIMGVVQGANHFATLALALCIGRSGIPVERLERWSTPSFRLALDRIRSLLGQPEALLEALMTETGAARGGVAGFRIAVEALAEATLAEERGRFRNLFHEMEEALENRVFAPRIEGTEGG